MTEELVIVERRGRVSTFTISRPDKLNSVNPEIMLRLGDTLTALKEEDEVRAVVIRGSGSQAFSSGYDIGRIGGVPQEGGPRGNPLEYGLAAIVSCPYPVIAMVYGYALGAGCHLAATCDLCIAADTALFGMPPAKLGLVYPLEGYQQFVSRVGPSYAKQFFLTGRQFSAQQAKEMGLVHQVVAEAELEATVYQLAEEIAEENAPLSMKGSKLIINKLAAGPLTEEDEQEFRRWMAQAFMSEDAREARAAFKEKRKPLFKGR
ncbi:MAG: enoyl-CoA hydratase-related protein [Chloroflexota bacterium]|nr:enoyl-CoA hydratase-related protein [Chloroflexota bacterium]